MKNVPNEHTKKRHHVMRSDKTQQIAIYKKESDLRKLMRTSVICSFSQLSQIYYALT